MKHIGENVVRIEADALRALADRLAGAMAEPFNRAVELLYSCTGRVVVSGMGKSGIIARKIAATLTSTGSPALFLHPAEAMHGDLGMVVRGDVVLALSASGETEEILQLLATVKRLGVPLITMTCDEVQTIEKQQGVFSTLAQAADVALDCSVAHEACTLGLAPTASTTTMLALGDALAVALSERRGFKEEDFANLHPGGKIGKRLMRVDRLMHADAQCPIVRVDARMRDVIYEMSSKGLGMTCVVAAGAAGNGHGELAGIITDGDLRRHMDRGSGILDLCAGDVMTRGAVTIPPATLAVEALGIMEQRKITSIVVVDAGRVAGVVHLHDLWHTEMF